MVTSATPDVSQLPVSPEFKKLARSQRLFSLATHTYARSLEISSNDEFNLFMAMRTERQWVVFPNDFTEVGNGDDGVQPQVAEAAPVSDRKKIEGASRQADRYGGKNHGSYRNEQF